LIAQFHWNLPINFLTKTSLSKKSDVEFLKKNVDFAFLGLKERIENHEKIRLIYEHQKKILVQSFKLVI